MVSLIFQNVTHSNPSSNYTKFPFISFPFHLISFPIHLIRFRIAIYILINLIVTEYIHHPPKKRNKKHKRYDAQLSFREAPRMEQLLTFR